MERSKLRCDHIGRGTHVPVPVLNGYRIFCLVVHAWIVERAFTVHLGVGDIGVPVGDRAPSSIGGEVHAGKAEGRRNERGRCLPSGRKALPSFRISASYLPGPQLPKTFFTVSTSMQTFR